MSTFIDRSTHNKLMWSSNTTFQVVFCLTNIPLFRHIDINKNKGPTIGAYNYSYTKMGVIKVSIRVIVMLAIDVKNTELTQLQNCFCINK